MSSWNKFSQKIALWPAVIIMVIGLLILPAPQGANAMDGGAGFTLVAKEFGADLIARLIVARLIRKMTNTTVKWIQGGDNPGQNVGMVGNFGDDLKKELDRAGGEAINQLGGINFCDARLRKNINFSLRLPPNGAKQQLGCTMTGIIKNTQTAYEQLQANFEGGWPAFINYSMRPQNNPNGSFLLALDMSMQIQSSKGESFKEGYQAGGGILGVRSTEDKCDLVENKVKTQAQVDLIMFSGAEGDSPDFSLDTYDKKGDGADAIYVPKGAKKMTRSGTNWIPDAISGKWAICRSVSTIKTPGKAVSDMLSKTLNIGYDFTVVGDELNEAITSIATALMNKVMSSPAGIFDKEAGALTFESFKGGETYKQLEWGVNKSKAAAQAIETARSDGQGIYAECKTKNNCTKDENERYDKLVELHTELVAVISPKLDYAKDVVDREFMFINSAQDLSDGGLSVIKKLATRKSTADAGYTNAAGIFVVTTKNTLSSEEEATVTDLLNKSAVGASSPKLPYIGRVIDESTSNIKEIVTALYKGKISGALPKDQQKDIQEFIKDAELSEEGISNKLDDLAKRGDRIAKTHLNRLVEIVRYLEDVEKIDVPDLPFIQDVSVCTFVTQTTDITTPTELQLNLLAEIMRTDRAIGVSEDGKNIGGADKLESSLLSDIGGIFLRNLSQADDSAKLDALIKNFDSAASLKQILINHRRTLLSDLNALISCESRSNINIVTLDLANAKQANDAMDSLFLIHPPAEIFNLPGDAASYLIKNRPADVKTGLTTVATWTERYKTAAYEKLRNIQMDAGDVIKFMAEKEKLDDLANDIGLIWGRDVNIGIRATGFETNPGSVLLGLINLGNKSAELDKGILEFIRTIQSSKQR